MRAKDSYPNSGKPFRSARPGPYYTVGLVNNRAVLRLPRGTYRLTAVLDLTVVGASSGVLFAVGRDDFARHFPALTWTAAIAEPLPITGPHTIAGVYYDSGLCAVEVDVMDGEVIWFWSNFGSEIIKAVKVGELPPRDPEVNDNHSANWE